MRKLKTVEDVARWNLCIGCGACAYGCPEQAVKLVDIAREGIRPVIGRGHDCGNCAACLSFCPSYELDYTEHDSRPGAIREVSPIYGPVLEIWEGHATDSRIRFAGSSGGALTALSLFCIERMAMHGVLHIASDPNDPVRNVSVLSRNRAELLSRTGSRYAPASVCDGLRQVEEAPEPCVVIGQPCEAAAIEKARKIRPALDKKVGLVLSFFCAGSPSTQGTVDLLKKSGIERDSIKSLRYRGEGWPGHFVAYQATSSEPSIKMTYADSWHFLQKYRPYSVHLWPDDTGEAADISCGDPWYQQPNPGDIGSSLLIARTEHGRQIIEKAIATGYLSLTKAEPWKLVKSQANLSIKRRAIIGRRLAFRLFGLPLTRIKGLPLFGIWFGLSYRDKLDSFFGTIRRIVVRKYYRPRDLTAQNEEPGSRSGFL